MRSLGGIIAALRKVIRSPRGSLCSEELMKFESALIFWRAYKVRLIAAHLTLLPLYASLFPFLLFLLLLLPFSLLFPSSSSPFSLPFLSFFAPFSPLFSSLVPPPPPFRLCQALIHLSSRFISTTCHFELYPHVENLSND